MDKHPRIIITLCLVISAIAVFYILRPHEQQRGQPAQVQIPSYSPPQALAKSSQESTVGSPDGKWSLTMKEEKGKENTTYRFTVSGDSGQKEISTKTVPLTDTLSIPANTFSPDNKYVFLKETGPNGTEYFVLTTSGDPIAQDSQTLDFSALFAAKYQDYKITDATGWGGVNLIVFNTDKASGGQGPSFWFEVPSNSFIQLSNRFN